MTKKKFPTTVAMGLVVNATPKRSLRGKTLAKAKKKKKNRERCIIR